MREARPRDDIDALYQTPRWRKVRKQVLIRDHELCQECKRRGDFTRGNTVHHLIHARDDISKFFDLDNLETICLACHNKEHTERTGGKKRVHTKHSVVKFYPTKER